MDGLALANRAGDKTVTRRVGEHQPCAVGDVIAVCEALVPKTGIGPRGQGSADYVFYRSDGDFAWKERNAVIWPWKVRALIARYCPAWAVRTFLRVVDVRREELGRIDDEDARREGIRYLGLPETREAFLPRFQTLHRGITLDTLIWRIGFERDVDASFLDPRPDAVGPDHRAREIFECDVRARFPVVDVRGAA